MKLEEIEKLCNEMINHLADCEDAELAQKYMPKLLKVAKAAKMISDGMKHENYYVMGAELLEKPLEELEK